MGNITVSKILEALNPLRPPEATLAGIIVYLILLLALIGLFLQKQASTRDQMLIAAVIVCCLIDKITATSILRDQVTYSGFTKASPFGSFIIRVVMFAVPLVCAGSTKTERARMPLIAAGILGGFYLFGRWFFEIRPQ